MTWIQVQKRKICCPKVYVSSEVHLEQDYSSKFPESLTSFSQVLQSLIEKKKYMFDNFFHCQKFDYFFPYLLYLGNLLKVNVNVT